jgi:hypothetical protein
VSSPTVTGKDKASNAKVAKKTVTLKLARRR